jgi:hypothetical protein
MRALRLVAALVGLSSTSSALASTADCRDALVVSTYNLSSNRFRDARLATAVTQAEYDQVKHEGGASAVIYDVPVGANYGDFQSRARQMASSYNSSLTESEVINVLWTGIDAQSASAYSACLAADVLQGRGLHLVTRGASGSDLTLLLRYTPIGDDPVPRHVAWQPSVIAGVTLPDRAPAGDYILRVPRPARQMQIVVNGNGMADSLVIEPLSGIGNGSRPPQAIVIPASSYLSARSLNVEVGGGLSGNYGPDTLHNGPPYGAQPDAAEWQFTAVAGSYWFEVEYAAATPRPVTIIINGRQVSAAGLSAATGGWGLDSQRWVRQLPVTLQSGSNTARLENSGGFPHILALRFVPR